MRPVIVPATDVNSETAEIVAWHADDGTEVRRDQLIAEVETSKSVIEVVAAADGVLLHGHPAGAEVRIEEPIGLLFPDRAALEAFRAAAATRAEAAAAERTARPYRATRGAEELAERHGVDLVGLAKDGLITIKGVERVLAEAGAGDGAQPADLPAPLHVDDPAVRRVVLFGSGLGATQVLDILAHDPDLAPVAILDEDPGRWGAAVDGVPVVGGTDRLKALVADGAVDAAIVAISTSVEARARLRQLCHDHGLPLANAIDPTARIASGVRLGQGNVLCAFCHLGVGAVVGDNNFLSAYNSYDHHAVLGDDISTGPGCVTSGLVRIGDRVRMGTGVFVEPRVEIGADAVVASGSVIVTSVPEGHVVKARTGSTVVSPRRR